MKAHTMLRIAQAIQLLQLDGFEDFTLAQLAKASGVSSKTLQRNAKLITIIKFALSKKGYNQCTLFL